MVVLSGEAYDKTTFEPFENVTLDITEAEKKAGLFEAKLGIAAAVGPFCLKVSQSGLFSIFSEIDKV